MRFFSFLFFLPAFLFFFMAVPCEVRALTTAPVKLDLRAEPGTMVRENLVLYNESGAILTLKGTITNVTFGPGERGIPIPAGIQGSHSLAEWMSLFQTVVTLAPGEKKEIPVVITIPSSARAGGYYAQVSWSPIFGKQPGVKAIEGVGNLVILRVAGDVIENAQVASFGDEAGRTLFEKLPLTFLTRIQNTGTIHIAPIGEITILDSRGVRVAVLPFNQGREVSNILPGGEIRRFETTWDSGFRLGRYSAVFRAVYGESPKTLTATYTFSVMPTFLLALWLCISILVILFCIGLLRKSFEHKF